MAIKTAKDAYSLMGDLIAAALHWFRTYFWAMKDQ
jgi:hypothetical protein